MIKSKIQLNLKSSTFERSYSEGPTLVVIQDERATCRFNVQTHCERGVEADGRLGAKHEVGGAARTAWGAGRGAAIAHMQPA